MPQPPPPPPPPPPPAPATAAVTQTATIRNAVNLKKGTLRLVVLPGGGDGATTTTTPASPPRLGVAFSFDATAPAAVSVFFGAAEDPARRCALACAAPPAKAVLYPKGLGHIFPPPGGRQGASPDDDPASSASLSADSARALAALPLPTAAAAGGGRAGPAPPHALVIRLEALTPAGAEAGLDLASLTPGAPHVDGVQSQTTFAALVPGGSGGGGGAAPASSLLPPRPRVLTQKIWVGGVSYELQEIYGMEPGGRGGGGGGGGSGGGGGDAPASPTTSPAPLPSAADDADDRACVICLTDPRDTTALPCRHMCMCHACAQALRAQSSRCPICRHHVESLLHIRLAGGGGGGGAAATGGGEG